MKLFFGWDYQCAHWRAHTYIKYLNWNHLVCVVSASARLMLGARKVDVVLVIHRRCFCAQCIRAEKFRCVYILTMLLLVSHIAPIRDCIMKSSFFLLSFAHEEKTEHEKNVELRTYATPDSVAQIKLYMCVEMKWIQWNRRFLAPNWIQFSLRILARISNIRTSTRKTSKEISSIDFRCSTSTFSECRPSFSMP